MCREGQGSDNNRSSSNNISETLSTTNQTESDKDAHHEFIPHRSTRVRQNEKYSHMIS